VNLLVQKKNVLSNSGCHKMSRNFVSQTLPRISLLGTRHLLALANRYSRNTKLVKFKNLFFTKFFSRTDDNNVAPFTIVQQQRNKLIYQAFTRNLLTADPRNIFLL